MEEFDRGIAYRENTTTERFSGQNSVLDNSYLSKKHSAEDSAIGEPFPKRLILDPLTFSSNENIFNNNHVNNSTLAEENCNGKPKLISNIKLEKRLPIISTERLNKEIKEKNIHEDTTNSTTFLVRPGPSTELDGQMNQKQIRNDGTTLEGFPVRPGFSFEPDGQMGKKNKKRRSYFRRFSTTTRFFD